MLYIDMVPGLVCGLALCVEDMARRRVPRSWVFAAMLAQLGVLALHATIAARPSLLLMPMLYGVAGASLQLAAARLAHGSLGMGDVTCTWLLGHSVGVFGLGAFLRWWLAMGLLGLAWIGLWVAYMVWLAYRRMRKAAISSSSDLTSSDSQGRAAPLEIESAPLASSGRRPSPGMPFVPVIVASAVVAIAHGLMAAYA
ncbi:hypothetical protein PT282_04435 [Bifidobacterium sp. ESL0763]|uniref:hypothetical protein n=1 Tax=Bifidobacterium sp. ESL0763 TaxID=2983227 RepID=UPI0023F7D27B|nr:hypothetical protein [Bifidobacterium sp. ESL0763]MDF7663910.1 hypothetical protein [Bifidobacterium sp. ESL0763]